jgi:hypothetical protein
VRDLCIAGKLAALRLPEALKDGRQGKSAASTGSGSPSSAAKCKIVRAISSWDSATIGGRLQKPIPEAWSHDKLAVVKWPDWGTLTPFPPPRLNGRCPFS